MNSPECNRCGSDTRRYPCDCLDRERDDRADDDRDTEEEF